MNKALIPKRRKYPKKYAGRAAYCPLASYTKYVPRAILTLKPGQTDGHTVALRLPLHAASVKKREKAKTTLKRRPRVITVKLIWSASRTHDSLWTRVYWCITTVRKYEHAQLIINCVRNTLSTTSAFVWPIFFGSPKTEPSALAFLALKNGAILWPT